jgi:hypothetical protein
MKFSAVIAFFATLVATSFAMDQPSFHTKGVPTGKRRARSSPASTGGNQGFHRADRLSHW